MDSSSKIPDSHEMNIADYIDALHSHGWEASFRKFAKRGSSVDEARGAKSRPLDIELRDEVSKNLPPSPGAEPFPKKHD